MGIDLWLWGSVANRLLSEGRTDYLRMLRDTNMVIPLDPRWAEAPIENKASIFNNSSGDFKNIVALLLMLNQPRMTQYIHVPRRRGWIGNQHRPFMAHHAIKLALDTKSQLKLVSETGIIPQLRRGGRVRGHYCRDETARDYERIVGCIHDWVPTDAKWIPAPDTPLDERLHWLCKTCEGKRWWRSEHERGGTGYVLHDHYDVSTIRQKDQPNANPPHVPALPSAPLP